MLRRIIILFGGLALLISPASGDETGCVDGYPYYVQQLLQAFPDQASGAPQVEMFVENVRLAEGVIGDTCLIRVPAAMIHGRETADDGLERAD